MLRKKLQVVHVMVWLLNFQHYLLLIGCTFMYVGCRTNFFISRNQCIGCPDNSVSNYPNDTECQCSDNYRRRHLTVTDVCLRKFL